MEAPLRGYSDLVGPERDTMKKQLISALACLALLATTLQDSDIQEAPQYYEIEHSGCCSYHGGVCGCSGGRALCCDGALSPSCGC